MVVLMGTQSIKLDISIAMFDCRNVSRIFVFRICSAIGNPNKTGDFFGQTEAFRPQERWPGIVEPLTKDLKEQMNRTGPGWWDGLPWVFLHQTQWMV